jgi:hypothetical protein
VGPTAGLDDVEERKFLTLPGLEFRPLGGSVRSQSLYRLRYPGSLCAIVRVAINRINLVKYNFLINIYRKIVSWGNYL